MSGTGETRQGPGRRGVDERQRETRDSGVRAFVYRHAFVCPCWHAFWVCWCVRTPYGGVRAYVHACVYVSLKPARIHSRGQRGAVYVGAGVRIHEGVHCWRGVGEGTGEMCMRGASGI